MTLVRAPVPISSFRVLHPVLLAIQASNSPPIFPFTLNICHGSIVEFQPTIEGQPSAIVNAANIYCLGGGGVDGAISTAGGNHLHHDRIHLPILGHYRGQDIRCPTGSAVVTGPGTYGSLHVPYVIHAVGPDYNTFHPQQWDQADELLQSAYTSSLYLAKEKKLSCVAFSLLSAGVYRGKKHLQEILQIGLDSIVHFDGYEELKDISLFAFSNDDLDALTLITGIMQEKGLLQVNSIPTER